MEPTRRDLVKGVAALGLTGLPAASLALETRTAPPDVMRPPDLVRAFGADGEIHLESRGGAWSGGGVEVGYRAGALTLNASVPVTRVHLRWRGDVHGRFLGDHWERSYADLGWRGEMPGRPMPWSFLVHDGRSTHGVGVMTGARAMCFWAADAEGISLWADVRSGGVPVRLGDRTLAVATVVRVSGGEAFDTQRALCRAMCPAPRLADHPIYGTNDWNYAYGNNSAELIAGVGALVSELSPDAANRPYSVIDDGWSSGGRLGHGPWVGNERFGDMGAFAARLKGLGLRPGLWFRPLTKLPGQPDSWLSSRDKDTLDPTVPEVREHVAAHFRRFRDWGYEMVKHDFTTWDILGRWGFGMGATITNDGWRFHDDTKTTAEVLLDLYATIREAAGPMRLLGCNTVGQLTAGTHEAQRTGDDTSGRSWDRTRRMGVNTLAFRAAQQGTFFTVDPDIVALTDAIPWSLNRQWLDLVSRSGAALFVSVQPGIGAEQKAALRAALARAAKPQAVAEPLDWLETDNPRRWRLDGRKFDFAWMGEAGPSPFGD